MAIFAIHAASKGKFWKMNDILFSIAGNAQEINIEDIAKRADIDYSALLGSINDPKSRHQLKLDIWKGMKLRVTGTPSYLIDGKLYQGQIPPEMFKKILN